MINAVAVAMLVASGACVTTSCGENKSAEQTTEASTKDDVKINIVDKSQESVVEEVTIEEEEAEEVVAPIETNDESTEKKETAEVKESPKAKVDKGKRQAMEINDADGWTRVRKEPNDKSKELFKVQAEKKFYVTKIEGSKWCKFYWTEDGEQEGYIHGEYIKSVGSKKAVPNEYKPTGKYHVIIGSFDDFDNAKAKYDQLSKWAEAEMFLEKDKKKYRVSIYSSTDKSKAENVKADVAKDGYPDAWILKY
ncbi:MAG: SPOR domain-containing protein [Muribaculaceae bacterium]|nr:SPOR domain-containing protein [Muribaculaceae bacterium]